MAAQTFNQKVALRAMELIDQAVAQHTVSIVAGQISEAQYRRLTGVIAGLHEAATLVQQALKDVENN